MFNPEPTSEKEKLTNVAAKLRKRIASLESVAARLDKNDPEMAREIREILAIVRDELNRLNM